MRGRQQMDDAHVQANRAAVAQLHNVRAELDRMAAMTGSQLRMVLARRAAAKRR